MTIRALELRLAMAAVILAAALPFSAPERAAADPQEALGALECQGYGISLDDPGAQSTTWFNFGYSDECTEYYLTCSFYYGTNGNCETDDGWNAYGWWVNLATGSTTVVYSTHNICSYTFTCSGYIGTND